MSITRYQNTEHRLVHRRDLRNCPYNPRSITATAQRRLKASIKTGKIDWPRVNERTVELGFPASECGLTIVSGHQRITILDWLQGSDDYQLEVLIEHWDPATERGQVVAHNNPAMQGEYDLATLEQVLIDQRDAGVDIEESMGFDTIALQQLYGQTFGDTLDEEGASEAAQDMAKSASDIVDEMKERKRASKEADDAARGTFDFYVMGVFKDDEDRARWLEAVGALPEQRYIPGSTLWALVESGKTK